MGLAVSVYFIKKSSDVIHQAGDLDQTILLIIRDLGLAIQMPNLMVVWQKSRISDAVQTRDNLAGRDVNLIDRGQETRGRTRRTDAGGDGSIESQIATKRAGREHPVCHFSWSIGQ